MSYDLMVFNPEAAPKTRTDFMNWFDSQTKWSETHDYQDPSITTENLRNWFFAMIQEFPAMSGLHAVEEEDVENESLITLYTIGLNIIYVGFSWDIAEIAYPKMIALAEKHKVGFFDVSATDGSIFFPDINEKLRAIDQPDNLSSIDQIKGTASQEQEGKSVKEILFNRIFGAKK